MDCKDKKPKVYYYEGWVESLPCKQWNIFQLNILVSKPKTFEKHKEQRNKEFSNKIKTETGDN